MTRTRTTYEWDVEHYDPKTGDIEEHYFEDSYMDCLRTWEDISYPVEFMMGHRLRIVLVRDVRNAVDGDLIDRTWAYVKDDALPEFFHTGVSETSIKVPKRFHQELKAAHVA